MDSDSAPLVARYLIEILDDLRARYENKLTAGDRKAIDEALRTAVAAMGDKREPPRSIDRAEACRLRAEGLTFAAIAEILGVSRQAVQAALKVAEGDDDG